MLVRTPAGKVPGIGYPATDFEVTTARTSAMRTEPERAYHKREPVAVVLRSPHWAHSKCHLTKLADPKGT
ncbi:glycine betaine ABC transporter substrate-binding protein [Streptomyces sp. YGL11-2]|uniref:glycine betaine ABC transporter substrate-binding protein n=1 Tax=Streptomyces sp. YGL11-2 TaxID=3414028 RepID=UPI003CF56237